MKENTIFIQIASYRDPELINTIDNCIDNSKFPENLKFCIANQFSQEDSFYTDLDKYRGDPRFIIIDVPYSESKGACWARNLIQQEYGGETYTLQLDSHHRFALNWDEDCIDMIKLLQKKGHKKPLLTSYISSFDPENDPDGRLDVPWRMVFDRFIPEGAIFFLPEEIPGWRELSEPVPSRFYSAHFCFTLGEFSKEVQHDPEYYFHGEEISIAARAYTHGYDLFHPHKIVAWHEYTRKGRTKQWDDDSEWVSKNNYSHLKNRRLFSMDGENYLDHDFGIYGFGSERTLRDYEKYSGILFSKRAVQQYTLDKKYPPNPTDEYLSEEDWEKSFHTIFKHCLDVHKSSLKEEDYEFLAVICESEDGKSLYRKDYNGSEIKDLLSIKGDWVNIWVEYIGEKPYKWIVWPFTKSKGWMDRIESKI